MSDKKKKKKLHDKKARRKQASRAVERTAEKQPGTDLAALHVDVLRSAEAASCSVRELERKLLGCYPASDAEPWDRMGLLVGDPSETVRGIAIALDPTVEAVRVAKRCGANVLITHHPVFIEPPAGCLPEGQGVQGSQAVIWEAVAQDVALMNFHTALDVSNEAANVLPRMLNLIYHRIVEVTDEQTGRGYGQLCSIADNESPMTVRTLAARCLAVFGRPARVWGDFDARIGSVVTCTGSAGDVTQRCVERGYDCLVCGEIRYHDALAASQAGLCIIELGHDVSELPLCALLAATVEKLGFPEQSIKVIDQSANWAIPEATRK